MRTLRAVLLIVGLACVGECCYQQAIAAGMTQRWTLGVLLSMAIFVGGVAVLAVIGRRDGRAARYATDAGEREADRALARGWERES